MRVWLFSWFFINISHPSIRTLGSLSEDNFLRNSAERTKILLMMIINPEVFPMNKTLNLHINTYTLTLTHWSAKFNRNLVLLVDISDVLTKTMQ